MNSGTCLRDLLCVCVYMWLQIIMDKILAGKGLRWKEGSFFERAGGRRRRAHKSRSSLNFQRGMYEESLEGRRTCGVCTMCLKGLLAMLQKVSGFVKRKSFWEEILFEAINHLSVHILNGWNGRCRCYMVAVSIRTVVVGSSLIMTWHRVYHSTLFLLQRIGRKRKECICWAELECNKLL